MTIRIETVPVEVFEQNIPEFSAALENAVNDACARLESMGARILGPVTITPISASWTEIPEGSASEATHRERGVVATITYEIE